MRECNDTPWNKEKQDSATKHHRPWLALLPLHADYGYQNPGRVGGQWAPMDQPTGEYGFEGGLRGNWKWQPIPGLRSALFELLAGMVCAFSPTLMNPKHENFGYSLEQLPSDLPQTGLGGEAVTV